MTETIYSSRSELHDPSRFFADAVRDLRRSPAVAWRLFRRNVQARHRRAWLGYLWLILPTLATTGVWVYVQSRRLVDVAPTGLPYPIHVLCGMILWQVFSEAMHAPLQQLGAGRQMITRSRVPHEALILAGLYETLLNCVVRLLLLAVVLVASGITPGLSLVLAPAGVLALALLGLAFGSLAAPFGMLYDDVGRGITLVAGLWFFLTPVIYRANDSLLLRWNPVTPLLDSTRAWLTGGRGHIGFVVVAAAAVVLLVVAWLLHRLARPHLVARLG